jgi:hypothetical protein
MIRRRYFGWHKDGAFYLSRLPPDSPTRPCTRYDTTDEIKALLRRRGVSIFWSPPLPDAIDAEIQKGARLEG